MKLGDLVFRIWNAAEARMDCADIPRMGALYCWVNRDGMRREAEAR